MGNITVSKLKPIYLLEFFWLLLLLVYASLIYLNLQLADSFFNSDWVMFFRFFSDLFLSHGHYKDWVISPAPHFFPDMFVFFPFFLIVKNIYFQFLTVMWLMIILCYLSIRIIYNHFCTKQATIFTLAAVTALFLMSLKKEYPFILALVPATHIGEFIAGLFLLGIHLSLISYNKLDYKKYSLWAIAATITFFSSLSDLLFVVQFVCPIFIAYTFLLLKKKIKFNLFFIYSSPLIICAALGGFLAKFLVPKDILLDYLAHPLITKVSISGVISQFFALIKVIKNINNHETECILGIFYFSLLSLVMINFISFKKQIKLFVNTKVFFFSIFILSSILINFGIFLCLNNPALVLDRYFINFYYFPFLLFFFPFFHLNYYGFVNKIMYILAFLILLNLLANIYLLLHKPDFKLHTSFYPAIIRCIDNVLHEQGHNGAAKFWDANYLSSISKYNLQMVPLNPDLTPFYWSINSKKFENLISFFILDHGDVDSLEKEIVYKKFGIPSKEVICLNKTILIYPKDSIKIL